MSGGSYRLLAHTADMGIEARASNRAAVVEQLAAGLAALTFGRGRVAEVHSVTIAVRGDDLVELLVACLNEVLYCSEKNNLVPAALHVATFGAGELRATLAGETFDPQRHGVQRQVKAVTYHQACLEEGPQGWYARVYVDL